MTEEFVPENKELKKIEVAILDDKSRKLQKVILEDDRVAGLLKELDQYHHDTYLHILRVGILGLDLGIEEKMNEDDLTILGLASHLHDVGKMEIDLSILDKKDKLDEIERSEIKTHVRKGFVVLTDLQIDLAKRIMAQHHEYQPEAYPRTLEDRRKKERDSERRNNDEIVDHLGQILAIADMTDALTSARAYKEPLSKEKVEEILRSEFLGDPVLIERVLSRL